ncbi:MAG: TonB-dependent receptor [Gemmatimonadaceae bacterium]
MSPPLIFRLMLRSLVRATLAAATLLAGSAASVEAQSVTPAVPTRDSTRAQVVDTIRVLGRIDDLIGSAKSASEGRIGAADLRQRPITREGELLETVPGVIVTQHSGEGKANQYFVRGFNLDHGTDFQTRLDGMPVNMPTHGHGQGWTDLNFLIPELVDYLDYKLGVYHAEIGDFGSAGAAEFHLVRTLERPFASMNTGANGLARVAAGGSRRIGPGQLLLAGEAKAYDGPWIRAEGVRKYSSVARYSVDRGASRFSVLGMAYRNRWNSNDQIAERAVDEGLISRFGQIDSTVGGNSQRYSLSGNWRRVGARSVQNVDVFGIRSDLTLFSNFTYFLDDPVRGDQFSQTDRRTIVGGSATHTQEMRALGATHAMKIGLQTRADLIDGLGLYRTERQVRFATVREDRVREVGSGLFLEAESRWRPWFRSVLGVRGDVYTFDVTSDRAENSGRRQAAIASPKASLVFAPTRTTEVYLSGGFGFHSNDARGTTITVDPVSNAPARRVDPLVRSRGAELGLRTSPVNGLRTTVSLWALDLDSELLFVGDAGTTEPSGASQRRGVTLANFYRPIPALTLDADVSFAHARFASVPVDVSYIPGALERVVAGGVTWTPSRSGPYGAVRVRHFGAYPLLEDNGVRAPASTLLNADAGYRLASGVRLQLTMLNLLNGRANDIAYFYTSRLEGEPAAGLDGVHAHPVEPRQVRVALEWGF